MNLDIILDGEHDLAVDASGDWSIGDTFHPDQMALMTTGKNDWKENPIIGIDAFAHLEDEDRDALYTEIRSQYELCGMEVAKIESLGGKILITRKS